MSKKVRRVRRSTTPKAAELPPEEKPAPRPISSSPASVSSRRASLGRSASVNQVVTIEEMKEEYAYVVRDLRWVFILAGIMFTLLIVLNLVLT